VEFVSSIVVGGWRHDHAPDAMSALRPAQPALAQRDAADRSTLGALLAGLLPPLALQAALRVVAVESDLQSADLDRPVADAAALGALLERVLDNAVEHNLLGGLVWLGLVDETPGPVLVVADTGFGMGEAATARLQAALGPGVTVQSVLGAGTRVRILLDGGAAAAQARAAARHDGAVPVDELEGTVLCIEDHDVDFYLIEEALARWPKVRVMHAAGVQAALEAMTTLRPSVTLLDMRLTDGTGMDVLRPVRSNPATAGLRVFVLSADAMPHQMRAAFDAGADGYWTKPLDIDHFLEKMQELLLRDHGDPLRA